MARTLFGVAGSCCHQIGIGSLTSTPPLECINFATDATSLYITSTSGTIYPNNLPDVPPATKPGTLLAKLPLTACFLSTSSGLHYTGSELNITCVQQPSLVQWAFTQLNVPTFTIENPTPLARPYRFNTDILVANPVSGAFDISTINSLIPALQSDWYVTFETRAPADTLPYTTCFIISP
jgi:hypothetical protein